MHQSLDFLHNFNKYKGSSIFLILSGPSVTPYVVKRLSKPYLMKAGVNNVLKTIRTNIWMCVDPPDHFLGSVWKDPAIEKYIPAIYLPRYPKDCSTQSYMPLRVREFPNTYGYDFTTSFKPESILTNKEVFWGTGRLKSLNSFKNNENSVSRNVAPAAIDILIKLGFKNIYLVGADGFRLPNRLHSYKINQKLPKATLDSCLCIYSFLDTYFKNLKDSLPNLGVNIYNCSRSSSYSSIPYIPLTKAINKVTKSLGYPEEEKINLFHDHTTTASDPVVKIVLDKENISIFDNMDDKLNKILNGDINLPETVNEKYSEYNM